MPGTGGQCTGTSGGYTIYVPDIAVVSKEAKEGITAELADLHEVAAWIRKENKK